MRERETRVKDPVCGMWVDTDRATASVTHDGRTYYFCAEACKEAFEKQPELYLSR